MLRGNSGQVPRFLTMRHWLDACDRPRRSIEAMRRLWAKLDGQAVSWFLPLALADPFIRIA